MILLPFFGRYFNFKFRFFYKLSIFLKFSNCCIIIALTTYFENIQYCKVYFDYGLGLTKTSFKNSASFFGRYFHFKFLFFYKMSILLKFSNCRIIIAQTTYFGNIQYRKIYLHYGLGLVKTSYNDYSSSFFGRYSHLKFRFFKKGHFSQIFKLPQNFSLNYSFCEHLIL